MENEHRQGRVLEIFVFHNHQLCPHKLSVASVQKGQHQSDTTIECLQPAGT